MSRANDAIELLWLLRKSTKNSPNDMDTVTMWAEMSDKATNARQSAAPDTHFRNAILDIDVART